MDLTPNRSGDDTEADTPPHTETKLLSFTNGAFYRCHPPPQEAAAAAYKECMKNHAAAIGGHAVDGCGEFMPPSSTDPTTSLKCAACGCHRNYHRRELGLSPKPIIPPFLDFRHPPMPKRYSLSPSPPPPHRLLALSAVAEEHHQAPVTPLGESPASRKRFRSKFSREQKEKMRSFSEKLGWKIQKCDESSIEEFCHEIGISRGVLKVWMHNNKNTIGKKESGNRGSGIIDFGINGGQ